MWLLSFLIFLPPMTLFYILSCSSFPIIIIRPCHYKNHILSLVSIWRITLSYHNRDFVGAWGGADVLAHFFLYSKSRDHNTHQVFNPLILHLYSPICLMSLFLSLVCLNSFINHCLSLHFIQIEFFLFLSHFAAPFPPVRYSPN